MKLNTLFSCLALLGMLFFSQNALAEVKVRIQTSMGDIDLSLNEEKAPKTVANFMSYVKSGFYEGTVFHRVIPDFMIQGGGLDRDLRRKATNKAVENEGLNGLKNVRGSIAMARTSNPDSATSQFFINHKDNDFLDSKPGKPGYTVFGKVIAGMDVVDKIARLKTGQKRQHRNVPLEPVEIKKIELLDSKRKVEK